MARVPKGDSAAARIMRMPVEELYAYFAAGEVREIDDFAPVSDTYMTPLGYALAVGDRDRADILIAFGATGTDRSEKDHERIARELEARDDGSGKTHEDLMEFHSPAFYFAVGNMTLVKTLVYADRRLHLAHSGYPATYDDGYFFHDHDCTYPDYACSPLHLAACIDDVPLAKFLLEPGPTGGGIDVNVRDSHQMTPLHHTRDATGAMWRCLIDGGANVNAVDTFGRTALFNFVDTHSFYQAAKAGANFNVRDIFGITPLSQTLSIQNTDLDTPFNVDPHISILTVPVSLRIYLCALLIMYDAEIEESPVSHPNFYTWHRDVFSGDETLERDLKSYARVTSDADVHLLKRVVEIMGGVEGVQRLREKWKRANLRSGEVLSDSERESDSDSESSDAEGGDSDEYLDE